MWGCFESAILNFFFQKRKKNFCFISMKISSPFIWSIIYFCTMQWMVSSESSKLICTQLYILHSKVEFTQGYTRLIYCLPKSLSSLFLLVFQWKYISLYALSRPSNLDAIWLLNSLLNLKDQKNWLNKCYFCLVTLSSRLFFVIVSLLQHKFLEGKKWVFV